MPKDRVDEADEESMPASDPPAGTLGGIDDVVGERLRRSLADLSASLTNLHREIVNIVRADYERERGERIGAGAFLQALVGDPGLRWLRPLAESIVAVDTIVDRREVLTYDDLRCIADEVDAMLSPTGASTREFGVRFDELLQNHPAVALAHGLVRGGVAALRKHVTSGRKV